MNANRFAELRIWDLDRMEARHALRGWLSLLPQPPPYRRIAQRRLGRFVVLYVSGLHSLSRDSSIVWLYADLDALKKIIEDAKTESAKDGVLSLQVQYYLLADALAIIEPLVA